MSGRLEGKVALITGACSGMGRATAKLFLEEGAKVVGFDLPSADIEQWEGVQNFHLIQGDVSKLEDVDRMIDETEALHGRLDALCNIAGINDLSFPLFDTDDARWDRVIDIDLKAPFRICRKALPLMINGGGGSIVNIGSYAALRGNHGPSYTAAKAGLAGLTKSIAFDFMDKNIRCNIIHPGGMRTNITETSGGNYHPNGAKLSKIVAAMPVLCYADPVEIAKACLFLCSDDSTIVTGVELSVDLGMSVC